MKIDISRINTIHQAYNYIDKNAYNFRDNWEIADFWVKYRTKAINENDKEKAQWEIECFNYDFKGNILFSQVYSPLKNAQEILKYPDLTKSQNEGLEYIKQRISNTKNSLLLSRYYHLLWKMPNNIKKEKYASSAIKYYIKAIKELYDKNGKDYRIGQLFETLIALCNDINYNELDIKELAHFLIFKANIRSIIKYGILDDMLKYPKIFKQKDFENTLEIFDYSKIGKNRLDDFMLVNYYLPTAIKIASKIKSNVKKWYNEIGLAYLRLANNEHEKERLWLKLNYYFKAIEAFQRAGNKKIKKKLNTTTLF